MPRKNKFEAVKTRSMSNEVAASSSQNIMDNRASNINDLRKRVTSILDVCVKHNVKLKFAKTPRP